MRSSLSWSALLLVGLVAGCTSAVSGHRVTPAKEDRPPPGSYADTLRASPTPASHHTDPGPQIARGLEVYRRQYCGTCHQLDATGSRGIFGPTHNGIAAVARQRIRDPGYTGTATTAEAYLRESILDPGIYLVPEYEHTRFRMPAYTTLSEADLDAVVDLLLQEEEEALTGEEPR